MVYLHSSDKHKEGKDPGCLYGTACLSEERNGAVFETDNAVKSLAVSEAKGVNFQLETSWLRFCAVRQSCQS